MSPEASQRLACWLDAQPDWVREVYYTHGAIHHTIGEGIVFGRSGEDIWRDIARSLLSKTQQDAKTIAQLEAIAPKRIKGPDGAEWIWRCPDHLIPISEGTTPPPEFP